MRNLTRALLSLSIVVLSSLTMAQTLVEQANQLIQSNEFLKAEMFIISVDSEHKEYEALQEVLDTITPAKALFVQNAISEANLYYLNRNADYGSAIFTITEALKVMPNNTDLLEAYASIDAVRKVQAQRLQQEILLNHGKYLLDVAQYEKSVKLLYPEDESVAAKYDRFLLETQRVANELAIQARYLLNDSIQLAAAHDIALLAFQLDPNEEIEQIYNQIDQRIKTRSADIQAEKTKQQREQNVAEINYWTDQFSVDLTNDNITDANRAIKELESFGVDTNEYKRRLDRKMEVMVQRALIRGNTLWSEGRIEDALAKWLEVQPYGRNNRILNNNISKAQNFIAYYNEVKQQNQ